MKKILIVEDDGALQEMLADHMADQNYLLDSATDGHEAFEKSQQENYDIVLLDLNLPDLTGLELLERIKASSPKAQVIFMSGNASKEDVIQMVKEEAVDYLEKPFSVKDLDQALKKAKTRIHKSRKSQRVNQEIEQLRNKNWQLSQRNGSVGYQRLNTVFIAIVALVVVSVALFLI